MRQALPRDSPPVALARTAIAAAKCAFLPARFCGSACRCKKMASEDFSAEIQAFPAFTLGKSRPAAAAHSLPSQLQIACSTYNVHSSSISCDLSPWIECHFSGLGPAPDIVVIGMQEITATPRSLISEESQEGCDWGALLHRDINACSARAALHGGSPDAYMCLVSRQLVGMSLYVFVSHAVHTLVASASSASLPLGALGNMLGNKGAIEVRLIIGSFTLQFINCHLIPHPPNLAKRNQQVEAIFAHFPAADFTVFLGDMNYRVDLDSAYVRELAAAAAFPDILQHCQMNKVKLQQGSPFEGFSEAPITFAPSYSYDVGTDVFDSSAKARIPSYCDRILWRARGSSSSSSISSSSVTCGCSSYQMAPLNASDHILQLSMSHASAESRASLPGAPIAPMNIGAHSRLHFATSGGRSRRCQPPRVTLPTSDADIDRRRLMLARASSLCLSGGKYDHSVMPRELSLPVPDAVWRGSHIPALVSQRCDGRWAPDESSSSCMRCGAAFSAVRRRHHCRWCGCLLCGGCGQAKRLLPPANFGGIHAQYKGQQSVCAQCADRLDSGVSRAAA